MRTINTGFIYVCTELFSENCEREKAVNFLHLMALLLSQFLHGTVEPVLFLLLQKQSFHHATEKAYHNKGRDQLPDKGVWAALELVENRPVLWNV